MNVQDMAQNSSFLDEIDREATKVRADVHLQKGLLGIGISLKTTQIFLTIFWKLHILSGFKAYLQRVHIFSV